MGREGTWWGGRGDGEEGGGDGGEGGDMVGSYSSPSQPSHHPHHMLSPFTHHVPLPGRGKRLDNGRGRGKQEKETRN